MSEDEFDEAVNDMVDEVVRRAMSMSGRVVDFIAAVADDLSGIEIR